MAFCHDRNNYDCLIEFDGASKGNPGKSGAGAVVRILDYDKTWHLREGLGITTCNVAEYRGLILGLRAALEQGFRRVLVSGDSLLVYNQVRGNWHVRNPVLKSLNDEVQDLRRQFDLFRIRHVGRENNQEANSVANKACRLPNGCIREEPQVPVF